MKNNLVILVLIFLLNSCVNRPEEESIYFTGSFDDAVELAKTENKGVFLDFFTVWCGGCKSFDSFVFSDSIVQSYIGENFIFMSVDAEKGHGLKLRKKFEINAYPTLIIANESGSEYGRIIGFDGVYVDNVQEFINKIEAIKKGIGTLKELEAKYEQQPDNYLLMDELINKYINHGKYEKIESLALKMMDASSNELKVKGEFYNAISWASRSKKPSAQQMRNFVKSHDSDDSEYRIPAYYELQYYYQRKNNIDSIDYYYDKVIELSSDNWYEQKKYAKFLFENNLKIDIASKIARAYPLVEDHYKPLLMAYTFAYEGDASKGVVNFRNWLDTYANKWKIEDSQWAYYYFAEFSNKYNLSLENALVYIRKLENYTGNLRDKSLLAEILYKLNKKEEAVKVLNEALEIVDSEKSYKKINDLINQYKK